MVLLVCLLLVLYTLLFWLVCACLILFYLFDGFSFNCLDNCCVMVWVLVGCVVWCGVVYCGCILCMFTVSWVFEVLIVDFGRALFILLLL